MSLSGYASTFNHGRKKTDYFCSLPVHFVCGVLGWSPLTRQYSTFNATQMLWHFSSLKCVSRLLFCLRVSVVVVVVARFYDNSTTSMDEWKKNIEQSMKRTSSTEWVSEGTHTAHSNAFCYFVVFILLYGGVVVVWLAGCYKENGNFMFDVNNKKKMCADLIIMNSAQFFVAV